VVAQAEKVLAGELTDPDRPGLDTLDRAEHREGKILRALIRGKNR
jgi:hypothetical protein